MTQQPIVVLGGTGKTGRRVTEQLQRLGREVRAVSRRTQIPFDWADETGWDTVLDGTEAAYIIPDDSDDGSRIEAFVRRATQHRLRRLVLLSAREWVNIDDAAAMRREDAVRQSGLVSTILRPVWFSQDFSEMPIIHGEVLAGEVTMPTGDGRHPFIDVRDIAAVAVAALLDDGHDGETYELTGPRAITMDEALEMISRATGRRMVHRRLTPAEYPAHMTQHGHASAEEAEIVAGLAELIRSGQGEHLSDGVQRALGREPIDFADYVTVTARTDAWQVEPARS